MHPSNSRGPEKPKIKTNVADQPQRVRFFFEDREPPGVHVAWKLVRLLGCLTACRCGACRRGLPVKSARDSGTVTNCPVRGRA